MSEICFITPCMGRLGHLQQSLPAAVAQPRSSCVVVDYSCPERCGDWVEGTFSSVRVVRAPGRARFCLAAARNLGAEAADSPWLCFLDADILLEPAFAPSVIPELAAGHYYLPHPHTRGLGGMILCPRSDFVRVGGYDDVIQGWGAEDADLLARLEMAGLKGKSFPAQLVLPLQHEDDLRVRHYDVKDRRVSHATNRIYLQAKLDLMKLQNKALPLQARQGLYEDAARLVQLCLRSGPESHLRIAVRKQGSLLGPEITTALVYTMAAAERPGPKTSDQAPPCAP